MLPTDGHDLEPAGALVAARDLDVFAAADVAGGGQDALEDLLERAAAMGGGDREGEECSLDRSDVREADQDVAGR